MPAEVYIWLSRQRNAQYSTQQRQSASAEGKLFAVGC